MRSRRIFVFWAPVAMAWATVLASPPSLRAQALPELRVIGESRLAVRTEREPDGSAWLVVTLRDERGHALPERQIDIEHRVPPAAPSNHTVRVDERGEARLPISSEHPISTVALRFAGDEFHEAIRVERTLDLERLDVSLELRATAGAEIDLDGDPLALEILATSPGPVSGIALSIKDELGRPLAMAETDEGGRAEVRIDADQLGAPGPGRIVVRAERDARRNATQAELPILRVRRTQLTLEGVPARGAPGDAIEVHGVLRDRTRALSRAAIDLLIDGRRVRTVLTDADGAFVAALSVPSQEGPHVIDARFTPRAPGHLASRSPRRRIEVAPPPPPSAWPLWIPAALAALYLLARAARRALASRDTSPGSLNPREDEATPTAVRWTGAADGVIRGQVRDRRGEPVARAAVSARGPAGRVETRTDEAGQFVIEPPRESVALEVMAEGYLPVRPALTRRSGRVEIVLLTLREAAEARFRAYVEPWLEPDDEFAILTNRELGLRAEARGASDAGAIADRADALCYAEAAPGIDEIEALTGSESVDLVR